MRRKPIMMVALAAVLIAAGAFAVMSTRRMSHAGHQAAVQGAYYCPMHPTYTSDRPGDCPICNMRLVARESGQASKDVCYLHNCPMVQQGRPCPMLVVAKAGEQVTCPICGTHVVDAPAATPGKRILYWTDPMIPGYRSETPGKSPMGMELVPVYAEDAGELPAEAMATAGYVPVLVTPQKQQLIGVRTAPAARRPLTKTIRTAGRIAYDPELFQAQEEYLQALGGFLKAQVSATEEAKAQAERLLDSTRLRLRLLGLSQELIQEMTSWSQADRRLLLADPSHEVWLYAPIYEYELPLVRAGQAVVVDVPAIPGVSFSGAIRAIDPVLDPMTRSARVRAVLADPDGALKPEMYVNASLIADLGEVLAVPEEAVVRAGTTQLVFVDKGRGLFEPRRIVAGQAADGQVEIREGLTEGETVVTSGNFLVDSESRLKAALQGFGGEHQHGQ